MVEETGGCKRPLLRIGTHSGSFHCDEALGCYLLRKTPAYSNAEIVRSRNPDVLRDLDVVIDVGGVYDPGWMHGKRPNEGIAFMIQVEPQKEELILCCVV